MLISKKNSMHDVKIHEQFQLLAAEKCREKEKKNCERFVLDVILCRRRRRPIARNYYYDDMWLQLISDISNVKEN